MAVQRCSIKRYKHVYTCVIDSTHSPCPACSSRTNSLSVLILTKSPSLKAKASPPSGGMVSGGRDSPTDALRRITGLNVHLYNRVYVYTLNIFLYLQYMLVGVFVVNSNY